MAEEELGPLPAGRHGLSPEEVAQSQRERLIASLAEAVAEHGYSALTITDITKAASVSRRAFYEQFASKEECFLAAHEIIIEHLRKVGTEAAAGAPDWPHQVIAALRAQLAFLASEPGLARLGFVEALGVGPVAAAHYRDAIHSFTPLLERGRGERSSDRPLPPSTEDSLIGALASMVRRVVVAGEAERLEELLPDFVEFVLTPYLGAEKACRLAGEAGERPTSP